MLCGNPALVDDESKACYFNREVLLPLKALLNCGFNNGFVLVDGSLLPNEYRLSVESLVEILKTVSPGCRRLLLDKIKCPSGAYSDLEIGFMTVDAEVLASNPTALKGKKLNKKW